MGGERKEWTRGVKDVEPTVRRTVGLEVEDEGIAIPCSWWWNGGGRGEVAKVEHLFLTSTTSAPPKHSSLQPVLSRYILFTGAPSLQQCLQSITAHSTPAKWSTFTTAPDDDGSQFEDADESEENQKETKNTIWEDDSQEVDTGSWEYQRGGHDETTGGGDETTTMNESASRAMTSIAPSCPILPPPSQPAPSNSQASIDSLLSTFQPTSQSQASFIGKPPNLSWDPLSLTPLNRLSTVLARNSQWGRPRVNVLGAVLDIRAPKEVKEGKWVAEWDLMDWSGGMLKIVMWDDVAVSWSEGVRRGDIIYLGQLGLSTRNNLPQATPSKSPPQSTRQICYRTKQTTEDDLVYWFHEANEEISKAAKEVMKVMRWYRKAFLN